MLNGFRRGTLTEERVVLASVLPDVGYTGVAGDDGAVGIGDRGLPFNQ